MLSVLFDSSVYISALRLGNGALKKSVPGAILWLSAVVLEELYAGARDRDRYIVQRLEHDLEKARRVLVPNLRDWARTGRVLARLAAKYGYERIGRERLTNDALIALSAGRAGITIVTANERDFSRLAEFCAFRWVTKI